MAERYFAKRVAAARRPEWIDDFDEALLDVREEPPAWKIVSKMTVSVRISFLPLTLSREKRLLRSVWLRWSWVFCPSVPVFSAGNEFDFFLGQLELVTVAFFHFGRFVRAKWNYSRMAMFTISLLVLIRIIRTDRESMSGWKDGFPDVRSLHQ